MCRVIQNKEFAMLFKVLLAGMCSLCLVGTATLASAHEFIVKPDKPQGYSVSFPFLRQNDSQAARKAASAKADATQ